MENNMQTYIEIDLKMENEVSSKSNDCDLIGRNQ